MRKGFTLIELLVVIGIIMLLVAMIVVGYRHLNRTMGNRDTEADLNAATNIVTSYKGKTYLRYFDRKGNWGLINIEDSTGDYIYTDNAPYIPENRAYVECPVGDATSQNIYSQVAVANTQKIMAIMKISPEAKALIDAFPGKRSGNGVLLDSWQQPIVFVPAGGLNNVILNGQKMLVRARDHLPFWVSAGQDGDFVLGEDNLYSTPVDYLPAK